LALNRGDFTDFIPKAFNKTGRFLKITPSINIKGK